ncbi:MAG: hypothetical protein K0V04_42420 [Deltaproteobacteria bacterium]|nr:hypothetical protein [Deltaproteobacteria bacterium]
MPVRRSLLLASLACLAGCPGDDGSPPAGTSDSGQGFTDSSGGGPPIDPTVIPTSGTTGSDTTATPPTTGMPGCGNGRVDDGEDCDDGGESATCNADCTTAQCGDTLINTAAGEDCDDGTESARCNADCTTAQCGDGSLNATAGETCDDRGESARCDADCTPVECGDQTPNAAAGEDCDDGNTNDGDFCSNTCVAAPSVALDMAHVFDTDTGELDGVSQATYNLLTSTWFLTGLEITPGGSLTVVGSSGLTIEVQGAVTIAGLLDVSGADGGSPQGINCENAGPGGLPGPGGFAGGAGAGMGGSGTQDGEPGDGPGGLAGGGVSSSVTNGTFGGAGGGGGGHSSPGSPGLGNQNGMPGAGGGPHASLPPLIGGAGGGGGGVEKDSLIGQGLASSDDEGTGGGGGGGAVAVHATVSITGTGTIDASGGDGGSDEVCSESPGGGGGGAGGAIELSSPTTDTALGTLDIGGGAGAVPSDPNGANMAGGDGSPGRLLMK